MEMVLYHMLPRRAKSPIPFVIKLHSGF